MSSSRAWCSLLSGLLATAVTGCYSATPPAGAACDDNGACPVPLTCSGGLCVARTTDAAVDSAIDARAMLVPSNGIDPTLTTEVTAPISIAGAVTFDTDTGAITGTVTRAAGLGVVDSIGYVQPNGLGVFVFADLDVTMTGSIAFTGSRAVAFLVGGSAQIDGVIDGSGGCAMTASCAGPGGGAGGSADTPAGGCGAGGNGQTDLASHSDAGGGGGGGGAAGANGGDVSTYLGGSGGAACIVDDLVPLIGGSGGGGAGPGAVTSAPTGGGGGGALQITALQSISITGVISMAGAGGQGGPTAPSNAPGGGGGGAGGGILLEAPSVDVAASGVLAANGGGGGGGADAPNVGTDGEPGQRSSSPALGGADAGGTSTPGGNGGAGMTAAQPGGSAAANSNAGGGGGAVGRIFVRSATGATPAGLATPPAGAGTIVVN